MAHTRKSEEFRHRVDQLVDQVMRGELTPEGREDVVQLLLRYTTDSSCMINAAQDEPVFVLRAKDPLFIPTLKAWMVLSAEQRLHKDKQADAHDVLADAEQWRSLPGLL